MKNRIIGYALFFNAIYIVGFWFVVLIYLTLKGQVGDLDYGIRHFWEYTIENPWFVIPVLTYIGGLLMLPKRNSELKKEAVESFFALSFLFFLGALIFSLLYIPYFFFSYISEKNAEFFSYFYTFWFKDASHFVIFVTILVGFILFAPYYVTNIIKD
jgi:hypothetical protein